MYSSTCSLNSQTASQVAAQRNFYHWVLKWVNSVHTELNIEESRDDENRLKPDVLTVACFLQAIGFKLVSFEKHNDAYVPNNDENDTKSASMAGVLKIMIDCGTSNMRAILELDDIACLCPNPDYAKDVSFWSISGAGLIGSIDNIVQKVEETGSNLLPRLLKNVTKVLHDVSIREERSVSGSQAFRSGNGSSTCPSKPVLQSQMTWDIETGSLDGELRSTPPKPIKSLSTDTVLSTSMAQIFLQDEMGSPQIAVEYIMGAQLNLKKALKVLSYKKPITSKHLSPNQDNDGASVKSAPAIISTAVAISSYESVQSCTINSSRSLPKLSNASHEQLLMIPKFEHAMIKLKARRSIQPTCSKSVAAKSVKIEPENLNIRRRNFYIPSSTSSSFSLPSKPLNAGKRLMRKTNKVPSESDFLNRTCVQARKIISPEPRVGAPQKLKTLDTTSAGTSSMIRPATKIPKFIPTKIKPTQASKIGTGIAKKSRMSMSN